MCIDKKLQNLLSYKYNVLKVAVIEGKNVSKSLRFKPEIIIFRYTIKKNRLMKCGNGII